MFAYKINARDFRGKDNIKVLKDAFNIDSYEELNDLHYILANEDKMKLPVGGKLSGEEVSSSIPIKFVKNPIRINNEDELFDLLDANRG